MIVRSTASFFLLLLLFGCGNESASESDPLDAGAMPVADLDDTRVAETASSSGSFEMLIMDIFSISGKGVVVTGQVKSGAITVGDTACVSGGPPLTVTGIEMLRETPDTLTEGDMGGLLFADLSKDDVEKGSFVRSCD